MPRFTPEDIKAIYDSQQRRFKVSEEYSESRQSEYVAEMVRQMKEKYKDREKIPPSTIQCASTQAILDRDPDTDYEHFNRPLPENWKTFKGDWATMSDEERRKAVGAREVTAEEVSHIESIRRSPKNEIQNDTRSATTPEKKKAAVEAFTYSPGKKAYELTEAERKTINSLASYEPPPPAIEEKPVKVSWWGKLWGKKEPDIKGRESHGLQTILDADTWKSK